MTDAPNRWDAPGGDAGGVLVIGYGNTLRSDDGVGWHAAALFADDPRFADVEVLARHQLAPELALEMSRASLVILIDAAVDVAPGMVELRQVQGHDPGVATGRGGATGPNVATGRAIATGPGASSHHVGVLELLSVCSELYGARPGAIEIAVGVLDIGVGDSLSEPVAAALPVVADLVLDHVRAHRQAHGG